MYYIGIDLGGTNIAVGLVDEDGKIIKKLSCPTGADREYPEILKDMADITKELIKVTNVDIKDIASIGIGSPGTPKCDEGVLVYANNFKHFQNVPMRNELQKYIDLPVYLDNDANVAALAEAAAGAAKGVKHSLTITLGTGLGGGVVIDGKVYSGFNNAAAEAGHFVIEVDGEQCSCGRKGCWEAYSSATGLINMTKKAALANPSSKINEICGGDMAKIDGKTAFDAMRAGDKTGIEVVDKYIKYLAEGLINMINLLQPEIIAIGGGICKEGDYLLKPLYEYIQKFTYTKSSVPATKITVAQLGNDAGIIGAAMLGKMR